MSQLSPIRDSVVTPAVAKPQASAASATGAAVLDAGQDRVEISAEARELGRLGASEGIRADKVAAIRAAIARGDYLSDDKIEQTIERLLSEITQ
jgi:flagellar biosynthesis anti-sigma factor FlgM